jgi:hypothetical protein
MTAGKYALADAVRDCAAPAGAIMAAVLGICVMMTLGRAPWPATVGVGLLFGVLAPAGAVFIRWADRR